MIMNHVNNVALNSRPGSYESNAEEDGDLKIYLYFYFEVRE